MKFAFAKGSTSRILTVFVQDSSATDGSGLAGLTEASSIVGGYVRMGGTGVALAVDENVTTEGTYQAPSAVGKVRIGTPANMRAGTYELHFHNDLFVTGADAVTITLGGATNMADIALEIQLTTIDLNKTDPLVLVDTTITVTSQTEFILAAGSADNDAYNGCLCIIEDATTGAQRALAYGFDYVGSSKTLTLGRDPNIFTMATGDKIRILAINGNEIADMHLDRVMSVGRDSSADDTSSRTVRQSHRTNRNRLAVSGGTGTVYKEDDSTASHTFAATGDASANPLVEIDPT